MKVKSKRTAQVPLVPTFGSEDGATLLVRSTKYSGRVWAGEAGVLLGHSFNRLFLAPTIPRERGGASQDWLEKYNQL